MRIRSCRICHNKKLIKIGSLGKIAVSDFTTIPSEGHRLPLELVYCQKCTLLQLAHNFDRDLLYKNYWYESHINQTIINDLKGIAEYSKGAIVHIDIGGNDGTMLKYSKALNKVSVDPSNIKPAKFQWINDYWEEAPMSHANVDLITAIACIYDLQDPNKFMKKIYNSLAPDGVFIAQLMTLKPFIENNDVGNICHEHIEYYSYKSLVTLYEQNGLEIFKVEENSINGGSYRIFARQYQKGSIKYKEKKYGVRELKAFFKRVEKNKIEMREFIEDCNLNNKKIFILGASTKLNSILPFYEISDTMIDGILEVNQLKVGKYTIETNIKIYDENKIDWNTIDYVWIAPYGFSKYFISHHEKWLKNRGKFITSIPNFKIINYADYKNM